jgi:hypothetical protein
MNLLVETEGTPRFSFEAPLQLIALMITEPRTETILWSIHPEIFEASPAPDDRFIAVPLPEVVVKVADLIKNKMPTDDEALRRLRAVADVTYGVVPEGFVERVHAKGLQCEREHRVSATAADFEYASKLFRLNDAK